MLSGKCVALGVTGGIAAYKSADLVSRLKKLHADVVVVMTRNAQHFITEQTMQTMSGNPVVSDMFARPETWEVEHIALAKRTDLFLVAPATANIIGKMANGIADDFLSTTIMATRAPILLAPAMNTHMWEHPATQRNMDTLRGRGVYTVGPGDGFLAEGTYGVGRMIDNEVIVQAAVSLLLPKRDLVGKRVLVTAGPTHEPLDPVRYLSNRSSGRMGVALAQAARERGAQVTLLLGPVSIIPPAGVDVKRFTTTQQLHDLALACATESDVVLQAAAPGDFRAEEVAHDKIKKEGGGLTLHLIENPDIAAELGANKREGQVLVAFAAETQNALENAQKKRIKKHADLIVVNDVTQEGAGFDVTTNIAAIIGEAGIKELPLMDKRELAEHILDAVVALWGG